MSRKVLFESLLCFCMQQDNEIEPDEQEHNKFNISRTKRSVMLGDNIRLLWHYTPDQQELFVNATLLQPDITWFALGFGKSMKDASAFVAWKGSNSTSGAVYELTGYSASDVKAFTPDTLVSAADVSMTPAGLLSFVLHFESDKLGFGKHSYKSSSRVPLIWAHGSSWAATAKDGSSPEPEDKHSKSSKSVTLLNFSSGKAHQQLSQAVRLHGILMLTSLLNMFVTPTLSLAMKFTDRFRKLAFYMHVSFATAAMAVGLAGMLVMVRNKVEHFATTHSKAGLAVLIITATHSLLALFRPHKENTQSKSRFFWEAAHANIGRILVLLFLITASLGILEAKSRLRGASALIQQYIIGLIVGSAICACLYAIGHLVLYRRRRVQKYQMFFQYNL